MPIFALRLLAIYLARHWLMTLVISMLAVFAASYFYFTATHALESFDSESCMPLALNVPGQSKSCVSSLQSLLDDDQSYPVVSPDGYFGAQTYRAVLEFQDAHHLTADGVVAEKTSDAINEFSPRPSVLSYAAGFANSKLTLTAKFTVAALMIAVIIACLWLRAAARDGPTGLVRVRIPLTGLFTGLSVANSAAADALLNEAHGWVDKFLGIILIGLATTLAAEILALFVSPKPPSRASEPQVGVDYGS
jgi:hypothetical protein